MRRAAGRYVLTVSGLHAHSPGELLRHLRLRRMNKGPRRGLGVLWHLDVDEARSAVRQRLFQGRTKDLRRWHPRRGDAEGFRQLDEVGVAELGRHHPAFKTLALVAPHSAIRG